MSLLLGNPSTWNHNTCLIFVSDGTEFRYTSSVLTMFQNFRLIWRKFFGCDFCVKCVMASNTFTAYQGRFKDFCKEFDESVYDIPIHDSSKLAQKVAQYIDPNNLDGNLGTPTLTSIRIPG